MPITPLMGALIIYIYMDIYIYNPFHITLREFEIYPGCMLGSMKRKEHIRGL